MTSFDAGKKYIGQLDELPVCGLTWKTIGYRCFDNGLGCFNRFDFGIKEYDDSVSKLSSLEQMEAEMYVNIVLRELLLFYVCNKKKKCKMMNAPATFSEVLRISLLSIANTAGSSG